MGCPVNARSPNVPPACVQHPHAGWTEQDPQDAVVRASHIQIPALGLLVPRACIYSAWSRGLVTTPVGDTGVRVGTWTEKAGAVKLWVPGQTRHLQGRVTGAELVLRWGERAQLLWTVGSNPQPRQTGFSRARDNNAHVMVFLPKARKGL